MLRKLFTLTAFLAAFALPAQVVVNEYSCANLQQFLDYFGDHEDWIELYNTSNQPVDLAGFFLSDDEDKPTKWVFPAGSGIAANGFLYIWCSGRDVVDPEGFIHTNFKMTQTKSNPEHIVLSNASGVVLQDIPVERTKVHQSRARFPDGSNEWRYAEPTLGGSNNNTVTAIAYAARPSMNQTPGFYTGSLTVAISSTEPNAVVRYTLDGSEPGLLSPEYTQPIELTQTTVIKAAAFSNNALVQPSFVQYNTYFLNETHGLAVMSVASDEVVE